MNATTAILSPDILRHEVSDEELEAAAEETALSYTFQTSDYDVCCN